MRASGTKIEYAFHDSPDSFSACACDKEGGHETTLPASRQDTRFNGAGPGSDG